jgi:hypothetical protein
MNHTTRLRETRNQKADVEESSALDEIGLEEAGDDGGRTNE